MNKNPVINLPIEIVLTNGGTSHCNDKSIPLRDIKNIRGNRVSGFSLERFNAAVVQKMLISDFVESIEIKQTEYSSSRMDLIDTTKLIIYGIIYRKYIVEIRKVLLASKRAEQITKIHPGVLLPEYNYNAEKIQKYFSGNMVKIDSLKKELSEKSLLFVNSNPKFDEVLKQENRLKVQKIIDTIDWNTWYVIYLILLGDDRSEVLTELDNVLLSCITKSDIAEYISLFTLELLQSAERAEYEYVAKKKKLIKDDGLVSKYLLDRRSRELISKYAKSNNNTIKLRYYFRWNHDEDKRFKFDISVIYDGMISDKMRAELEKKTRFSKQEFISAIYYSACSNTVPEDLGLSYFSYIQDACKNENISFNQKILSDNIMEKTEYLLMFTL